MEPTIFWGDCLRSVRVSKNLTQKEVASILHVTRQTYSCYETGRSHPSPEIIAILSNIYEVNLFEYAINCMPEEYVAEQATFKYHMPLDNLSDSNPKNEKTSAEKMKRKKKIKYRQTENFSIDDFYYEK